MTHSHLAIALPRDTVLIIEEIVSPNPFCEHPLQLLILYTYGLSEPEPEPEPELCWHFEILSSQ